MKKRLLSLFLALALALTLLPQTALLAEPTCAHEHTVPFSQSFVNTRGELCYALWQMAGCPEPTAKTTAYEDLSPSDHYYKAVLWAVEQKILIGYTEKEFQPNRPMTRAQIVTFLWRYCGAEAPEDEETPFVDIRAYAFYARAVEWAVHIDWIELSPSGQYFRPDDMFEGFLVEGTICEDCGQITETAKLTISEAVTALGTYGDNITWKISNDTLIITGSGVLSDLPDGEQAPWSPYADQIYALSLPEGLTGIGRGVFLGCRNLESVTIPEGVAFLGNDAFNACLNLKSVSIPGSVETIGDGAFCTCSKLKSVTIPEGVRSIGAEAFIHCYALEKVTLPDSLEHIGGGAFIDTAYENDPKNWTGDLLYLGNWAINADENIGEADIRPGTKGLADMIFYECGLSRVTIPDSVEIIGSGAFRGCRNLRDVTIPKSVCILGDGAFDACISLQHVTFSEGLVYIGSFAFSSCSALTRAELPAGVTFIGDGVFYDSTRLAGLTVLSKDCFFDTEGVEPDAILGNPSGTVIYGYKGATAEAYAKEHGYRFVALSEKVPFVDVPANAFYTDPVAWAVDNEITNGVDDTHFGPDRACTRGQVVTFLWRAAGCPEPETPKTAFTDLKPGAFYEKAVAWAVENRITNGTSATAFSPDKPCTRGQIVAFLYRFKESPAVEKADSPFTDLKPGAFYEDAVAWAVANKITNGMTPTTFVPDATCTRGQVVTFLYRATAE